MWQNHNSRKSVFQAGKRSRDLPSCGPTTPQFAREVRYPSMLATRGDVQSGVAIPPWFLVKISRRYAARLVERLGHGTSASSKRNPGKIDTGWRSGLAF